MKLTFRGHAYEVLVPSSSALFLRINPKLNSFTGVTHTTTPRVL